MHAPTKPQKLVAVFGNFNGISKIGSLWRVMLRAHRARSGFVDRSFAASITRGQVAEMRAECNESALRES